MAAAPLDRVKALLAALPKEDQAELRRYLGDILVSDDEAESIQLASLEAKTASGRVVTYTYRQERVRCGKPSCWCADGGLGHGPYTYKYWLNSSVGSPKLRVGEVWNRARGFQSVEEYAAGAVAAQ